MLFTARGRWLGAYLYTPAIAFNPAPADLPECKGCNLILISLDTLRADRVGFNNPAVTFTPNLDKIAAHSAVFHKTYTNAFYTTPSHMTVFTSLYPHQHHVTGTDVHLARNLKSEGPEVKLDPKVKTLAETLSANGYHSRWAGPLHVKHLDFELGFGRGFQEKEASLFEPAFKMTGTGQPKFHAQRLKELLAGGEPHFLFLHSYVTHLPYYLDPPGKAASSVLDRAKLEDDYLKLLKENPERMPGTFKKWPAEMRKVCSERKLLPVCFKKYISEERLLQSMGQYQMRQSSGLEADEISLFHEAYDQSVANLDHQIGDLWRALDESGALKNSVVIIFSDHGEELFEHGRTSHSSFFEHTARVALMIYHPKLPKPQSNSQLVSLIDIMPTALKVLGIEGPAAQMKGQSLSERRQSDYVYGYSLGNDFVSDGNWKLLTDFSGRQKLFYLPLDRSEAKNLVGSPLPPPKAAYGRLSSVRAQFESGAP